jgi:Toprim domain
MPEPTQHEKNDYAMRLWNDAQKADGTHVETYLKARWCVLPMPPSLRYDPWLKHTPSGRSFPAMIAGICKYPSAEIIAIHRTYLNFDGTAKAPVENAKMMLGASSGGQVRFGACDGDVLWVAEGIETALSIHLATGLPTWATLSTSGMKAVVLPPPSLVPRLCIAADHDDAGIQAAETLAARELAIGRDVRIAVPPVPGQDFNDILREASHVS